MNIKHWFQSVVRWISPQGENRRRLHLYGFRILALTTMALGINYILWRYTSSLNGRALWFAIPLVLAETYSLIDIALVIFMMWKPPVRVAPETINGVSVDVFITTYNEPLDLVRWTMEAAMRIDWPDLHVYVLDDGTRPALKAVADKLGCGYITRGDEWTGKARHAKAGNVNNALLQTSGEFILILDADQIPAPSILTRTMGYFRDPKLAFVQTPQYFYNLPPDDPFGSDAPLFYGPILQGKDGWNAAFFCGSNAVLRREALMQLGLTGYVEEMEQRVHRGLAELERDLSHSQTRMLLPQKARAHLIDVLSQAHRAFKAGQSLETISEMVHQAVMETQKDITKQDLTVIASDLRALAADGDQMAAQVSKYLLEQLPDVTQNLTNGDTSPSMGLSPQAIEDLALTISDEAIPIQALATISITEDMATSMRLHALGWRSLFHPEVLAYGLAPEDLGSALKQRLRWAQGTIQVLIRDNPLFKPGLSFPQRVQYFTTMYSYFSGFFSIIYLMSPIIYLFTGLSPVSAWSIEFAWHLVPLWVLNKILFRYVARGISVWRGEQYNLALFPLWIQAVVSVFISTRLQFTVTPKQRQTGNFLPLVWPQILIILLTALACIYGLFSLVVGWSPQVGGIFVNIFWGGYNVLMLSAIIRAAVYKPPPDWETHPPAFLFPEGQPAK